jgi:hypothetical protein
VIRGKGWRGRSESPSRYGVGLACVWTSFAQDESKCAQASGAREAAGSTDSWRATTCRVPRLHCGQDQLSANFCGSVSSALMSGLVAWRWNLHRARAWRRLGLASSPKWQDVEQEAADELDCIEGHDTAAVVMP